MFKLPCMRQVLKLLVSNTPDSFNFTNITLNFVNMLAEFSQKRNLRSFIPILYL